MEPNELFASLEQKYGLPPGYLARTWQIESSSGRNMVAPTSSARGHFQFTTGTANAYGLTNPYALDSSADAASRLALDNSKALIKAGIENPTAAHIYLAHQQGAGGAGALLSNPSGNVVDVLAPIYKGDRDVATKAVINNGGKADMTASDFASRIMSKYDGGGFQPVAGAASNVPTMAQPQNVQAMQTAGMEAPTPGGTDWMAALSSPEGLKAIAGAAGLGGKLMAAGAPHETWQPGAPAPVHRPDMASTNLMGILAPPQEDQQMQMLKKRKMMMGLLA